MNPYLDVQKNPHIQVKVYGKESFLIDCFIDTGFTGGIVLPIKYKNYFQDKPSSMQRFMLADGSLVSVGLYKVKVGYKNTIKIVSGFFTKGKEVLIGIEFLTGFKFTLDLKKFKVSLD